MVAMDEDEVVIGGPVLSTAEVSARESFDLWSSIMSEAVLPCSLEPLGDGPFFGSLTPKIIAETLSIAVAANSAEIARRDRRHIARVPAPYVLAGLTLSGITEVAAGDGRSLRAPAGTMFIIDGEHPQQARTSAYQGVLVRVSKEALIRSSGLGEGDFPAVTLVEPVAHGGLVIDYFRRLAMLPPPAFGVIPLLNAGVELLGAALAVDRGRAPAPPSGRRLDREHLIRYLEDNLADPRLTTQRIAEACGMSRRKLFRVIGADEGGPTALLRGLRVTRARELLATAPDRTVAAIAHACGFTNDRNFYRVFRAETGMTPSEYREWILSRRAG
ncbi:helix-turn-helix domain-containing protein [Nocardia asteroides NBRC 15531]|uniref:AraC family transcriptional regulator n=2 Tax=Nocardia asteroides TaxID=1824 RepID=U5E638_NOCAS|nr:helix-turn-helix domain-containing protein [Nocardia asteroides NBRC 15531]GAD82615.1 putative AraC family transcriptional regulator [Nocardia asteroides NBRC 15531]SFM57868.1 AraC-type DNA-binding protein [Nocardia asteroides]VEG33206.1 L-rhamnose operon regulatory protein rhaS [Nocardia asteroides]